MIGKNSDTKTPWVDPDDAPELTEEGFARADLYEGKHLIRKGARPKAESPKRQVAEVQKRP